MGMLWRVLSPIFPICNFTCFFDLQFSPTFLSPVFFNKHTHTIFAFFLPFSIINTHTHTHTHTHTSREYFINFFFQLLSPGIDSLLQQPHRALIIVALVASFNIFDDENCNVVNTGRLDVWNLTRAKERRCVVSRLCFCAINHY